MRDLSRTGPRLSRALYDLQQAVSCQRQGQFAEAEKLYVAVAKKYPEYFDALHLYGLFKYQQGQFNDAARLVEKATKINPRSTNALNSLGVILAHLKRHQEAIASFDAALKLEPNHVQALGNRSNSLNELGRFNEAISSSDRAIANDPRYAEAYMPRGAALFSCHRYLEALESYDRSLKINPSQAVAWAGRGNVFYKLKNYDESFAAYDKALALKPDLADAWLGRGNVFYDLRRYDEAFAAYDKALAAKPDLPYAEGSRLNAKLSLCRWDDIDAECTHLIDTVRAGERRSAPFVLLALPATPADQLKCAQLWFSDRCPDPPPPLWRGEQYRHERIRVAYISPDYRDHPVAFLTAGMFESHDRSRFEVTGVSIGPDTDDAMRARLSRAFDRFLNVPDQTDKAIGRTLRELEIDIAVDLSGITENSRPAIFAQRPAPVQISYLGYCGTMGAAFYDYLLADRTAISQQDFEFFSEKVVWLPDSFIVNDRTRRIAERTPTRAELHLPENGFVFCCFNQPYKINPTMFEAWMPLLQAVDGSVLWLRDHNAIATHNLCLEAARRGVAPERLVFAAFVPQDADYLARQRQADLMLDTLNYNAHTTACDALWAGVPVLTCMGSTFAGRVAGGLLRAVGLPELVTQSLADYEALALKLAREPSLLRSLKATLARNRENCPLFDTARFTRNIETAYTTMWERTRRGEPPQSFAVEPPVS